MLGAFQVADCHKPSWVFNIGSGMDHTLRKQIWDNRDKYIGKIVKYKYLPVGTIDAPRHPVFLGLRDKDDM
jgi:DNA ligase-1